MGTGTEKRLVYYSDALLAMLDDQAEQHRNLLATFEQLETALAGVDYGDDPPFELFTLRLGLGVERAWLRWLAATTENPCTPCS